MSTTQFEVPPGVARFGRRTGYAIAVVVNLVALIVVQNILAWDVLPWLTDDFATVVPWISVSLVVSMAANLVYEFNDTRVVKSTMQIGVNLVSIVVASQVLRVFPFDFSAYSFDWNVVVRIVLILAMVGAGIGVITESMKLASKEAPTERR
jgi:hypothetical protein